MRRIHKLGAAALAVSLCLLPGVVSSRPKDRPVRRSAAWESGAAAEGGYLAWQQMPRTRPGHTDVYLRQPSGRVVKVNRPGTEGALGAIDDGTLVYQEYRGDDMRYGPGKFSRIVLYDLETGKRTVPARANGPEWEFMPMIWGEWIFYGEVDQLGNRHLRGVNRETEQVYDGYVGYVQPGHADQGYLAWVHWEPGAGRSEVRVRNLDTSETYQLASRRWQWAPSIGPQGAVYVLETGRKCGSSPVIKRFPRTLSGDIASRGTEVMRLPQGIDFGWSSAYSDANGHATVLHQRFRCGTKWGSDIYRFSDTVPLDVAKDGSGEGTVVGHGIDCGEDCAEAFSGGTFVTLRAEPELTSHFAGWSRECVAPDPEDDTACTFRIDRAATVTATFDFGPRP